MNIREKAKEPKKNRKIKVKLIIHYRCNGIVSAYMDCAIRKIRK